MRLVRPQELCSVLIVDDDVLQRAVIADILGEAGFATVQAADAVAALDLLRQPSNMAMPIGLVVTDVEMPGELDGIALAAQVAEAWPHVGVLVMSGALRGAAFSLCPPARFLAKPFASDRLIAAIHAVLDRDGAKWESERPPAALTRIV